MLITHSFSKLKTYYLAVISMCFLPSCHPRVSPGIHPSEILIRVISQEQVPTWFMFTIGTDFTARSNRNSFFHSFLPDWSIFKGSGIQILGYEEGLIIIGTRLLGGVGFSVMFFFLIYFDDFVLCLWLLEICSLCWSCSHITLIRLVITHTSTQ